MNYLMKNRKLSIFIDESGDLGVYNEVTDFLLFLLFFTTRVIILAISLIN